MYQQSFIAIETATITVPLLTVLASLFHRGRSKTMTLLSGAIIAFAFAAVGAIAACVRPTGSVTVGTAIACVEFDFVSAWLLAAVSFISAVVVCFSERYMSGEKRRDEFLTMLLALSCSSSCLIVSDSLLLTFVCWHLLSWGLWQAVRLQDGATKSARTVLSHHLLSDCALLSAFVLLWAQGIFQFQQLSKIEPSLGTSLVATLLVLSFSAKSALFPFHGWLISTLSAPTPLSAFLHAGVVNVSAILAWRMMPLLQECPSALVFWGLISIASAIIGTLSMSAQPDVKRKLVYSTVGQMGFMCLQCASGAVGAALFHLVAHGLFKCHMFLQSGSAVNEGLIKRSFYFSTDADKGSWKTLLLVVLSSMIFALAVATTFGDCGWTAASATITAASVFCSLQTARRMDGKAIAVLWIMLLTFCGISVAANNTFSSLLPSVETATTALLPASLVAFGLAALSMHLLRGSAVGKALYAHSLSGFYTEEIALAFKRVGGSSKTLSTHQEDL